MYSAFIKGEFSSGEFNKLFIGSYEVLPQPWSVTHRSQPRFAEHRTNERKSGCVPHTTEENNEVSESDFLR